MKKSMVVVASALTFAVALAGCDGGAEADSRASPAVEAKAPVSGDISQMKIAEIDFDDMDRIKEIARALGRDGPPFMSYVISRAEAKATLSQAEIARPDGAPPETVAEAVELAKAVRAKRAAARNA